MRVSGGLATFAKVAAVALLVVGCGRSSLVGNGGNDCPAGAHCVPDMAGVDGGRDMSLDMRPSDMLDMRNADMRGDMRPPDMRGDGGGNPECGVTLPCTDPRCEADPRCHKPGQEICTNGIDDDDDGLVDCADPDCANDPFCKSTDMAQTCDDGKGGV